MPSWSGLLPRRVANLGMFTGVLGLKFPKSDVHYGPKF